MCVMGESVPGTGDLSFLDSSVGTGQSCVLPSLKMENKRWELSKSLLSPCLGAHCSGRLQNAFLYPVRLFFGSSKDTLGTTKAGSWCVFP